MHPLRVTRKLLDKELIENEIKSISTKITALVDPLAIFVFGSAASFEATDQSDFDFLVVIPNDSNMRETVKKAYRNGVLSTYPIDLVWFTEEEFLRKREIGGICMIAWEDGRCTYKNGAFK
jgi:predicted nucleotidyltransferase